MIKEIEVSEKWFGCVLVISFDVPYRCSRFKRSTSLVLTILPMHIFLHNVHVMHRVASFARALKLNFFFFCIFW